MAAKPFFIILPMSFSFMASSSTSWPENERNQHCVLLNICQNPYSNPLVSFCDVSDIRGVLGTGH